MHPHESIEQKIVFLFFGGWCEIWDVNWPEGNMPFFCILRGKPVRHFGATTPRSWGECMNSFFMTNRATLRRTFDAEKKSNVDRTNCEENGGG